jgi:UDP-2,4-diacetamido-2,4,6-trideoxy-beta-L-altropyranose hydrolase
VRVVIRADAAIELGSGHVMRCLTLADELARLGAEVIFFSRAGAGSGLGAIDARNFVVRPLEEVAFSAGRLAAPLDTEIAETTRELERIGPVDLVIVDQYALDVSYERALRRQGAAIAVIDDLADREHDCDLLLDQNLTAIEPGRYDDLLPSACVRMLGPRYALLRSEFEKEARRQRIVGERVERVLIGFGGYDATDETSKAIAAVVRVLGASAVIDVLLPAAAPHAAAVERLCAATPGVQVVGRDASVAALMANADLAIGACGTTVWERAYLGLPSVVLTVADNQIEGARACAAAGMLCWLGGATEIGEEQLANEIAKLASDRDGRARMAARGQAIMGTGETLGTKLVAKRLMEVAGCL